MRIPRGTRRVSKEIRFTTQISHRFVYYNFCIPFFLLPPLDRNDGGNRHPNSARKIVMIPFHARMLLRCTTCGQNELVASPTLLDLIPTNVPTGWSLVSHSHVGTVHIPKEKLQFSSRHPSCRMVPLNKTQWCQSFRPCLSICVPMCCVSVRLCLCVCVRVRCVCVVAFRAMRVWNHEMSAITSK